MVSFAFVPNLASVVGLAPWRRRQAKTIMTAAMLEADAVIARLPSENGLLAAGLARRLAKPLAVEAVACSWDQLWNYGTVQGKLYAPVQMWRMRRAVETAPYAIYVSRFLRDRYPARGKIEVVSDVEWSAHSLQATLIRRLERIDRPKGRVVLGLIGSLQHRYKGVHTALEALARMGGALGDFEFRILGPGDPRPWQELAARHGLSERVRFCGILPNGEPVLQWLDEIDLYLQPSFQEGLGRALVEAMSRGCPALGSTAGGIPELLPTECLHRPGDARRLGQLIGHAARDPGWQAAQARRNFETAKDYGRDRLDGRRTAFLRRFARSAAMQQSASHAA